MWIRSKFVIILLGVCMLHGMANASYIASCKFRGKVISQPERIRDYYLDKNSLKTERDITIFQFLVTHSENEGEISHGCTHYINTTLTVQLNGNSQAIRDIKNKDVLPELYYLQIFDGFNFVKFSLEKITINWQ